MRTWVTTLCSLPVETHRAARKAAIISVSTATKRAARTPKVLSKYPRNKVELGRSRSQALANWGEQVSDGGERAARWQVVLVIWKCS